MKRLYTRLVPYAVLVAGPVMSLISGSIWLGAVVAGALLVLPVAMRLVHGPGVFQHQIIGA